MRTDPLDFDVEGGSGVSVDTAVRTAGSRVEGIFYRGCSNSDAFGISRS